MPGPSGIARPWLGEWRKQPWRRGTPLGTANTRGNVSETLVVGDPGTDAVSTKIVVGANTLEASRTSEIDSSPRITDLVRSIIADGCEKARKLAQETMREVREVMGLDYV